MIKPCKLVYKAISNTHIEQVKQCQDLTEILSVINYHIIIHKEIYKK